MSAVLATAPATRRNQVVDVYPAAGGIAVVLAGMAPITYASGIDALIGHIARELCLTGRGYKSFIVGSLCIDHAAVSRCRNGTQPIVDAWILRMHELSGIPVDELRWVGCVDGVVARHKNARPSRPAAV